MEAPEGAVEDRWTAIARSGARIIARDGLRALTHRAVDREAGIPEGSTSHRARTRRALLELIVEGLEDRTTADAEQFCVALAPHTSLTVDELADLLTNLIESLASRGVDMRARFALLMEVSDDDVLRKKLGDDSRLHAETRRILSQALDSAGLDSSNSAADDLIALIDSLLFYRTVLRGAGSIRGIVASYLQGQ